MILGQVVGLVGAVGAQALSPTIVTGVRAHRRNVLLGQERSHERAQVASSPHGVFPWFRAASMLGRAAISEVRDDGGILLLSGTPIG